MGSRPSKEEIIDQEEQLSPSSSKHYPAELFNDLEVEIHRTIENLSWYVYFYLFMRMPPPAQIRTRHNPNTRCRRGSLAGPKLLCNLSRERDSIKTELLVYF